MNRCDTSNNTLDVMGRAAAVGTSHPPSSRCGPPSEAEELV